MQEVSLTPVLINDADNGICESFPSLVGMACWVSRAHSKGAPEGVVFQREDFTAYMYPTSSRIEKEHTLPCPAHQITIRRQISPVPVAQGG